MTKNPWLKKNPFLSMWLSAANKVAGSARGRAMAAVKREATRASKAATTAATKEVLDTWQAALGSSSKPKPKRRR